MTLLEIHKSKTGKVSDKWESYLNCYDDLFLSLKDQPITLAEIGIQNGGSLETWAEYFVNAEKIIGVDIDQRCAAFEYQDPRINVYIQDAKIPVVGEYNIVIDDGSHFSHDMIEQFKAWFPLVKQHGIYIVEDFHTMWMEGYGSDALSFFCSLVSDINKEFSKVSRYEIASIEFRNSLVIIKKGSVPIGSRLVCGKEHFVLPG